MSHEQCWALNFDRSRCPEPAAPGQFFCEAHDAGYRLDPSDIFCLPEAEMPPELVAAIRDCCPTWLFPEPSPPLVTVAPAEAPAAAPNHPGVTQPTAAAQDAPLPAGRGVMEPEPLAWLMDTLRQVIEEAAAAEVPPLQKAAAVARLGALYLRTHRGTELTKENRSLRQQLAALRSQLTDAEQPVSADPPTACVPAVAAEPGAGAQRRRGPAPTHAGAQPGVGAAPMELSQPPRASRADAGAAPAAGPPAPAGGGRRAGQTGRSATRSPRSRRRGPR
jgi:hypothetical protein